MRRDLEKAVEELSQLLEEPVEEETVKILRQRMMDKTVCLESFRRFGCLNDFAPPRSTSAGGMKSSCTTPLTVLQRADGNGAYLSNDHSTLRTHSPMTILTHITI